MRSPCLLEDPAKLSPAQLEVPSTTTKFGHRLPLGKYGRTDGRTETDGDGRDGRLCTESTEERYSAQPASYRTAPHSRPDLCSLLASLGSFSSDAIRRAEAQADSRSSFRPCVYIKHQQCSERPSFPIDRSVPAGFQAHYRPPVAPTSHAHQRDGPGPQRCRTPHLEIEWLGSSTVATLSGAAGRFLPRRPIRGQRTCVLDQSRYPDLSVNFRSGGLGAWV